MHTRDYYLTLQEQVPAEQRADWKTDGHLVFVYGSLMSGHGNNQHFLSGPDAEFIGYARTKSHATMRDLGPFPAVSSFEEGPTQVYGEVYRVTGGALEALDGLEGVPRLYTRETVNVLVDLNHGVFTEGEEDPTLVEMEVKTYKYAGVGEGIPVVMDGDWNTVEIRRIVQGSK